MSFDFSNSLSGSGGGNSFSGMIGSYSVHPTYTTSSGSTSITPSFTRSGQLSSLSSNTGVNTIGATVNHQFTSSTSGFVGGSMSSNGQTSATAGINVNF